MRLEDLHFNIETINECIEELSVPITDRADFLNRCIAQRLDRINRIYNDNFDIKLIELEKVLSDPKADIITVAKAVKKFSKLSNSVYSVALELVDIL